MATSPSHMPLLKETGRTFISSASQLLGLEACMITNYCDNDCVSSGSTSCLPLRAWMRGRRWTRGDVIAQGHKTKFTLAWTCRRGPKTGRSSRSEVRGAQLLVQKEAEPPRYRGGRGQRFGGDLSCRLNSWSLSCRQLKVWFSAAARERARPEGSDCEETNLATSHKRGSFCRKHSQLSRSMKLQAASLA